MKKTKGSKYPDRVFTNRICGGRTEGADNEGLPSDADGQALEAGPQPDDALMHQEEFHDRGNPLNGFVDRAEQISLLAEEMARLFQWLIVGGEKRTGPVPSAARDMTGHQLRKALARPTIVACRVFAMLLRIRPDLLNGMEAKQVAKKLRISPRMMAFYTLNFGEHFPSACKTIRRQSRVLTERIRESRHER
jgi:hypothetical protein